MGTSTGCSSGGFRLVSVLGVLFLFDPLLLLSLPPTPFSFLDDEDSAEPGGVGVFLYKIPQHAKIVKGLVNNTLSTSKRVKKQTGKDVS